jgi:hypothetical protein
MPTLRFNSALLSLAAEFTGKYAPWQGIRIAPLSGGVSVSASDRGAATFIGWDPSGTTSEEVCLLPSRDLAAACRGIKTAERDVSIDGDLAVVTTYHKAHSTSKEFPLAYASCPPPPFEDVIAQAIEFWKAAPEFSRTAGRYDLGLLLKALKALGSEDDSVVLSSWNGGPLRLFREDIQATILLMPQEAKPIPGTPPWLADFAASGRAQP